MADEDDPTIKPGDPVVLHDGDGDDVSATVVSDAGENRYDVDLADGSTVTVDGSQLGDTGELEAD